MTKAQNIEKRWATTLKSLYLTDAVFIGIVGYFIFKRIGGDPDVPTYFAIALIVAVIAAGNIALLFFMKSIKDTVKAIVK